MSLVEPNITIWRLNEHNGMLPEKFNWASVSKSARDVSIDDDKKIGIHVNSIMECENDRSVVFPAEFHWDMIKTMALQKKPTREQSRNIKNSLKNEVKIEKINEKQVSEDIESLPPSERPFKRSEQAQSILESVEREDDETSDSLLVQSLRKLVVAFDESLYDFLHPEIPLGRKERRNYLDQRRLFGTFGYKQMIVSINKKIRALCKQQPENYDIEMFNVENDDGEIVPFKDAVALASDGDFELAQDVANSIMQILLEDQIETPRRRVIRAFKK